VLPFVLPLPFPLPPCPAAPAPTDVGNTAAPAAVGIVIVAAAVIFTAAVVVVAHLGLFALVWLSFALVRACSHLSMLVYASRCLCIKYKVSLYKMNILTYIS
jgi:hypothetical protein